MSDIEQSIREERATYALVTEDLRVTHVGCPSESLPPAAAPPLCGGRTEMVVQHARERVVHCSSGRDLAGMLSRVLLRDKKERLERALDSLR